MDFPDWVEGPTACATRSYKLVLPTGTPHRAYHKVSRLENRPTVTVRNTNTGQLHTAYSDGKLDAGFVIASEPIEEN
jgi:hypothetical protein